MPLLLALRSLGTLDRLSSLSSGSEGDDESRTGVEGGASPKLEMVDSGFAIVGFERGIDLDRVYELCMSVHDVTDQSEGGGSYGSKNTRVVSTLAGSPGEVK